MAFKITENKQYMGIDLDSIYCRIHIQVSMAGQVIAKPVFYTNEKVWKEGTKEHIKTWHVDFNKKLKIPQPTKAGEPTEYKVEVVKDKQDVCLMYLKLGQIEKYKNLVKEVTQEVIDTLLEVGFISNKKAVKIL